MNKEIPLVSRWRAIQNVFQFVENPIPTLTGFLEEFGDTYYFYAGAMNKSIVTANPKVIQHVLQKNHRNYKKSHLQTEQLASFAGKGLLTSDGPYWLKQRRLIQPGFHRAKIASLADIVNEVIEQSFDELDELAKSQQPFDFAHFMMELTFKVVARSLFSTSVTEDEMNTLAENLTQIQEFFIKKVRQPYLAWYFQLSGLQKAHFLLADDSKQIILRIINERRASNVSHDDLLDMLLSSRYEDTGEGMTDQQLLDEALIIFVAGHETSANALAWLFYLISNHPAALEKLRKESKDILNNKTPTFADLPSMDYSKWCIEEAMRIYPPAWITDRISIEDDEVDGVFIPKDTMLALFIYGTHHSKSLWENPEQFIPERFSKENKSQRPAYAYLPFGGGPRLCIGNNFAMMEMQLVLNRLIERYNFELVKTHEVSAKPMITLRPKNGIMMNVEKR